MNFYIDKPTLRDISAMRNLVLPEVQKGIILDRSEDEMAGAIRSYSIIRIAESNVGNSVLDMQFRTCEKFWESADFSPVSHPKFAKNHESQTENPSVVDSAESQNLGENSPIHCHSERSEESQKKLQNRDSSVASLPQNDNMKKAQNDKVKKSQNDKVGARVAESMLDSAVDCHESTNADSRNDNLKRRCESEFASPIVAFAALQILSLTLGEVRSLIVDENYRRNGLATMLIEHLLKEARALNLKEVLALTYQREVFEKLGFKEIAKESLPNQKIWADCIKCKKFPVCDEIALTKIL